MRRQILVMVVGILIMIGINFSIYRKERFLTNGTILLLELAPVDPRSLIQGDYMRLGYKIAQEVGRVPQKNCLIVAKDQNQVGHFRKMYEAQALLKDEQLLCFRRGQYGQLQLGAETFFFQEGLAHYYEQARYGELRVAVSGESVLVGLRDAQFKPLLSK